MLVKKKKKKIISPCSVVFHMLEKLLINLQEAPEEEFLEFDFYLHLTAPESFSSISLTLLCCS